MEIAIDTDKNKMVELNPSISVIITNVSRGNSPIKDGISTVDIEYACK